MQCTPGVNEDQRLMNGPFITYNGGMGTGSSNNENTAIQVGVLNTFKCMYVCMFMYVCMIMFVGFE